MTLPLVGWVGIFFAGVNGALLLFGLLPGRPCRGGHGPSLVLETYPVEYYRCDSSVFPRQCRIEKRRCLKCKRVYLVRMEDFRWPWR